MDNEKSEFEQAADDGRTSIVTEFIYFLKENKKWWLAPILLVIGMVGLLVVLGGSGAAPTLF